MQGALDQLFGTADMQPALNATNAKGQTPLHIACDLGNQEIIEWLIKKGANLKATDEQGKTALHVACEYPSFLGCDHVKLLLREGLEKAPDLINMRDNKGQTPLHLAARKGNTETATLLIDNGADINAKDGTEQTALHIIASQNIIASQKNQEELVAVILQKAGAEARNLLNARDNKGQTPLHLAVAAENMEIATLFIDKGADINAKDKKDKTVLHLACECWIEHENSERYLREARQKALEEARKKVREAEGTKNESISQTNVAALVLQDSWRTVGGKYETMIVQLLQKAGEQAPNSILNFINSKNEEGKTALHLAAKAGLVELADVLIDKGATLNATDNYGQNTLHWACRSRNKKMVELVLKKADNTAQDLINTKTSSGWSPLSFAQDVLLDQEITLLLTNWGI